MHNSQNTPIELQAVTRDNYEAICDLPLSEAQKDMLASNTWSLLEAAYNPGYQVRAIMAGAELVGFMMWVPQTSLRVSIWRFMIALPHQGRGLGQPGLAGRHSRDRRRPGGA